MAYLPSDYSVILMVMFSLDNCSHFVRNETFTNDCNTMSASSINMCCQDLILDLFGDMNLGQCYQDTSYRNYSQIQFECLNPTITEKEITYYFGVLLIMIGFCLLIYGIMKWTDTQPDDTELAKQEQERKTTLNQSYNIQNGKYQTFSEHK